MYESHFNLQGNPFRSTTEPELIYESVELRDALAHFSYALENGEAFVLLTGEVGSGKTTAVLAFQEKLSSDVPVATVNYATLNPRELLQEVAIRFGVPVKSRDTKPHILARLEGFLKKQKAETGETALLVFDEAQLLKPAVLEEVRLLSNLELNGSRLLHVFLVGQPELEHRLRTPELRPLRQRISLRYELKPLGFEETRRYLAHRLVAVGRHRASEFFTAGAVEALRYLSHGLPREINVFAAQSMLNAYLEGSDHIETEHVQSAQSAFGFEGVADATRTDPVTARPHGTPAAIKPATEPKASRRAAAKNL